MRTFFYTMGKESRRERPRTRNYKAPAKLPEGTRPIFESEFKPIDIPKELLESEFGLVFKEQLDEKNLVAWELGRKGTYISSRWLSADGKEDFLTSTDSNDEDYHSLMQAHIFRFAQYMGFT